MHYGFIIICIQFQIVIAVKSTPEFFRETERSFYSDVDWNETDYKFIKAAAITATIFAGLVVVWLWHIASTAAGMGKHRYDLWWGDSREETKAQVSYVTLGVLFFAAACASAAAYANYARRDIPYKYYVEATTCNVLSSSTDANLGLSFCTESVTRVAYTYRASNGLMQNCTSRQYFESFMWTVDWTYEKRSFCRDRGYQNGSVSCLVPPQGCGEVLGSSGSRRPMCLGSDPKGNERACPKLFGAAFVCLALTLFMLLFASLFRCMRRFPLHTHLAILVLPVFWPAWNAIQFASLFFYNSNCAIFLAAHHLASWISFPIWCFLEFSTIALLPTQPSQEKYLLGVPLYYCLQIILFNIPAQVKKVWNGQCSDGVLVNYVLKYYWLLYNILFIFFIRYMINQYLAYYKRRKGLNSFSDAHERFILERKSILVHFFYEVSQFDAFDMNVVDIIHCYLLQRGREPRVASRRYINKLDQRSRSKKYINDFDVVCSLIDKDFVKYIPALEPVECMDRALAGLIENPAHLQHSFDVQDGPQIEVMEITETRRPALNGSTRYKSVRVKNYGDKDEQFAGISSVIELESRKGFTLPSIR